MYSLLISSSQHLWVRADHDLATASSGSPLAVYEGKVGREAVQIYWSLCSRCRALVGMNLLSSTVPVRDDVYYN